MKMGKGLRSTNGQLHNSHGAVGHSLGSTVSDTVVTTRGARRVPGIRGEHFVGCIIVCPLSCTPETCTKQH